MRTTFCRLPVFFRTGFILILFAGICGAMPVHAEPSAFSLISPENGASVPTKVLLDWEDSTDPKTEVTYTLFLSEGNDNFDDDGDPIEGIVSSCYLPENSLTDMTTYYWKVRAVNDNGEISKTAVRHFTTNNGNPLRAFIGGHVYTSNSKPLINIDIIISKIWDKVFSLKTDSSGYFLAELVPENPRNPGTEETVMIEVGAKGCEPKSVEATVVIGESKEIDVVLKFDGTGDINMDLCLDLKDAVSVLQILTQQKTSGTAISEKAPLSADKKIGLAELTYILQGIAEPSLCSENSAGK